MERLGTVWIVVERFVSVGDRLGVFWERLRASRERLGNVLLAFRSALAFGRVWERSGNVWEVFLLRFGSVREAFERVLGCVGTVLEAFGWFGNGLGAFGGVWERLGVS